MTWDEIDVVGVPPSPRSEHAVTVHVERYLLIFGGGSHATCYNDLHVLDLQTMEWSRPTQQDQNNTNDGPLVSRQNIQEKSMFGPTAHGINSRVNMENLQQMNHEQRFVSMQDFNRRQELAGSSELSSQDKIVQVPPSQNVVRLDPTEEKILFGSDDSPWDGFGTNISDINILDGTDSSSGFPSLQSGSWSVLLQSAVAETPRSDMGIQEEWSVFGFRNMGQLSGNEQLSTTDGSKRQSVWANSNMQTPSNLNSRPFIQPDDHDRLQTDSQRPIPQWLLFLFRGAAFVDLSPHPFAVADAAYRLVINGGINQSVLAHQDGNGYPKCTHVVFGLVLGDDGKRFQTRSTETVRLVELLDGAKRRCQASLLERDNAKGCTEEEIEKTSNAAIMHKFTNSVICHEKLEQRRKSLPSGKRKSLKPRLPCIIEENENVDEIAGTFQQGIGPEGMNETITRGPPAMMPPTSGIWISASVCACDEVLNLSSDSNTVNHATDAIHDGVDILSLSLGPNPPQPNYFEDAVSVGAFHAFQKGILVSTSAGNSVFPQTACNVAPWILIVAASTLDRELSSNIYLGNSKVLKGFSLNPIKMEYSHSLIHGSSAAASGVSATNASFCKNNTLDPTLINGKIVICTIENFTDKREEKSIIVKQGGGVGRILIDHNAKEVGFQFVTGLGLNILTAWSPVAMEATVEQRSVDYNIISGTSMSCPHISVVAAIINSSLPEAVEACVDAAGHEFDVLRQQTLLRGCQLWAGLL
ncbi:hypothetical protein KIW84_011736 [Lathyrus oleraceus]|uniref:Uncharacterized protein n=1 Tax=Pisum sativum TaxID=3888 RepID=A0A9D5GVM1_PEA|nr:hypothetical protein KIW84_011736 [Pisum sativum]